jgi:hypothetical protein
MTAKPQKSSERETQEKLATAAKVKGTAPGLAPVPTAKVAPQPAKEKAPPAPPKKGATPREPIPIEDDDHAEEVA